MAVECIQDEESRLFLTSIGAWEGPISWTALWWATEGGAGKILVPSGGEIITLTLSYPALIVLPWGTGFAAMNVGFDAPAPALTMQVVVTDGNYTFEGYSYTSYNQQHWESPGVTIDTLNDWNKEGSTLKLLLSNPGPDELTAYIDSATLLWEGKPEPPHPEKRPQYLPIMGIG